MKKNARAQLKKPTFDATLEVINQRVNAGISRLGAMLGLSHSGKRDLYEVYGYDQCLGGDSGFARMYGYAKREGIANRLTHGIPKRCWRDGFNVLMDRDDQDSDVLVDELKILNKAGFQKKLEAADILNRIGRFSLLYVGVPDGKDPKEPLGAASPAQLKDVYFKAFAYDGVTIASRETDTKSPRFDLPVLYTVQPGGRRNDKEKDVGQANALTIHYTRIVHLNEQSLDSDIEGCGYLEPIFNRILDLDKVCGGSAEAYFRNARGKYAIEHDTDRAPAFKEGPTGDKQKEAFNEKVEAWTNEQKDFINLSGAKVHSIDSPQQDPIETIRGLLWMISGYSGVAIRLLTGEGSGQLAGSEDQLAYNQIIDDRRHSDCEGWAMSALLILSSAGMINIDGEYVIDFPQQAATTEKDQADINNKNADTLSKTFTALANEGVEVKDSKKVMEAVGLPEIEINTVDLSGGDGDVNLDEEVPRPKPKEPENVTSGA